MTEGNAFGHFLFLIFLVFLHVSDIDAVFRKDLCRDPQNEQGDRQCPSKDNEC